MSGVARTLRCVLPCALLTTALLATACLPTAVATPPTAPAPAPAPASDASPLQFADAAEARRFRTLVSELRCVMCQNQSLADSDALIAHELRAEVLELMREGRDDEAIRDYLVARYGEFVLYRPRVGPETWLLWFGPAVLLLLGGVVVYRLARRPGTATAKVPEDREQEW